MAVFTIYPDADGSLQSLSYNTQPTLYAAIAEAYAGTWSVTEYQTRAYDTINYQSFNASGEYYVALERIYYIFDTSILGGASVSEASLFVYRRSVNNPTHTIQVTAFNPTTTTQPVGTDEWGNFGSTVLASQTVPNSGGYYEWSLNANGLAEIDPSGDTFFGLRNSDDVSGYFDTSGDYFRDSTWFATEETGTTKDPYLEVVTASGGTGFFSMF